MNKKVFTLIVGLAVGIAQVHARENKTGPVPFSTALSAGKKAAVKKPSAPLASRPLVFIENAGQVTDQYDRQRPDIDFKVESPGVNVFIGKGAIHYQWAASNAKKNEEQKEKREAGATVDMYRMDVTLLHAAVATAVVTEEKQTFYEQYLEGGSLKRAYTYKKIVYKDVYPHIDWVFYFNPGGKLEHDFVIHPGGKVSDIQLQYGGATALSLDKKGGLTAQTPMGTVKEAAPRSYTDKGEVIASAFVLQNNVLRFKTAPHAGTLIIDPTLEWGTFYGGTGDDYTPNVANDPDGNVYMSFAAGYSNVAVNIVTSGAYQLTRQTEFGDESPFLVKFDGTGQRQWATHFGTSHQLYPRYTPSISCDPYGNLYILADTMLARFNGAGQLTWAVGLPGYEEFTYRVAAIQCDLSGNIYMTGTAHAGQNATFGTAGTYKDTVTGSYDAFLMKYDNTGTRLWGTFFGGEGSEQSYGGFNPIACDAAGNVYLAGRTQSLTGIATAGGFQSTFGGVTDAFLAKFSGQGQLLWSTYYGGEAEENGSSVSVDPSGNVLLSAITSSTTGISSPNSFQDTLGGGNDFFIAKFNSNGQRQWATYYGGEGEEVYNYKGGTLECDIFGNVVLYGFTNSPDGISSPGSYQENIMSGGYTVFLAKLNSAGQRLWGTYFGGTGGSQIGGYYIFFGPNSGGGDISCDAFGNIYITNSAGPNAVVTTPGSYQPGWGGGYPYSLGHDVFLSKFSDCAIALPGSITGDTTLCNGATTATFRTAPAPGAVAYSWILPSGWTGSSTADTIQVIPNGNSGIIGIVATAACGGTDTVWQNVTIRAALAPVIARSGNTLSTGSFSTYQWFRDNQSIAGATNATHTATAAGSYTVKVTDAFGCSAVSAALVVTTLGINDPEALAEAVHVYPNPSNRYVHISSPVKVNVTLTSVDGRKLRETRNATTVDIGAYAEGTYLLHIFDTKERLLKVVKLSKTK